MPVVGWHKARMTPDAFLPVYHVCLSCRCPRLAPLLALGEKGIAPEKPGHNVVYSYVALSMCGDCGHGQLERYSHDCWSHDDDWDMYWWFVLGPDELTKLRELMRACPRPLDVGCACPLHADLRASAAQCWGGVPHVTLHSHAAAFSRVAIERADGRLAFKVLD